MNNLHLLNNKSRKNNSKGFYIALGICLIAIGVAAWTTYDSVMNYGAPDKNSTSSTQQTNQLVSGIAITSEAPSSSPASAMPSSKPASSSPSKSSSVPSKQTVGQTLTFRYPVSSNVSQKYSGTNPVYSKTLLDWRVHTGVDLTATQGETVKSAADGTVKNVYSDDSLGNTVVITHGTIEAYYCGLGQTSVKKGDKVKKAQQIGTVGIVPSESADASHLHLAMKQDGKFIDPLTVLK